jgi:ribonuclease HI
MVTFLGAFANKVNVTNALEAEVLAVIEAICLAWIKAWKNLWLETDSSMVVHYFNSPSMIPWRFRIAWANCILLI